MVTITFYVSKEQLISLHQVQKFIYIHELHEGQFAR
jgi:hypothetical protein